MSWSNNYCGLHRNKSAVTIEIIILGELLGKLKLEV